MSPFRRTTFAVRISGALIALTLVFGIVPAVGAADDGVEGVVVHEHWDDFANDRSLDWVMLETKAGERLRLQGSVARQLPSGATVKLRGERKGETFVLADDGAVVSMSTTAASTPTINKKVLVLLANFTTDTRTPWTATTVRNVVFDASNSSSAWYTEVSNGKMGMTGDVRGWYTLNVDRSACNYSTWMNAAKTAATNAGVNLSSYTNYMLAFPQQSACSWSGLAQLNNANSWINGSMTLRTTTHELGHNFGSHHAATINCTSGGVRVSFSSSCTMSEYGDPFDVMGSGTRLSHTYHRKRWTFLTTSDQQTVTTSGTYFVATGQVAGGYPRILRVARPSGQFWYLEFRQPYGQFDNFSTSAAVVNGVSIRLAPDNSTTQTRLVDTTPGTSSFADAPLAVGATFTDPLDKISIKTLSIGSSGATVSVTFNNTPPPTTDTTPPSTPTNLTATSGNKVQLSWGASTDNSGSVSYRVYRDGAQVGTSNTTSYTDSGKAGTYTYTVRAVDPSGNLSGVSNSAVGSIIKGGGGGKGNSKDKSSAGKLSVLVGPA